MTSQSLNRLAMKYPPYTVEGAAVREIMQVAKLLNVQKLRDGYQTTEFEPLVTSPHFVLRLEMGHPQTPSQRVYLADVNQDEAGKLNPHKTTLFSYGGQILQLEFLHDDSSPIGLRPTGEAFEGFRLRSDTFEKVQSDIQMYLVQKNLGPWYT